jgi:hypothetical protein
MIPLINGQMHQWASIRIMIAGLLLSGITKIDYKDEQEVDEVYGSGENPIGFGKGNISRSGSLTLYAEEVERLVDASPTRRLQDLPLFDIVVSYQTNGKIHTHTLQNCKFKSNSRSSSQGDKSVSTDLPLFVGNILW